LSVTEAKSCANCGRVYSTETDFLKGTSRWRLCADKNLWFNCACGSTLFLKKGKFSWYSPTQGMTSTAATVLNQLSSKSELPYMKSTVFRLQEMLRNEGVQVSKIAKVLKGDPFLVSEVMNTAARLKAARGQLDSAETSTLEHAIVYVGLTSLSDMVMLAGLKVINVETKKFDIDKFWADSFSTAIIAEKICKKFTPYYKTEEAYLAGFLCNVGKMVSAYYFPSQMDALAELAKNPRTKGNFLEQEQQCSLIDHRVLGEIACAILGLAPTVLDAVMKHHDRTFERSKKYPMHEMIALANQMSSWARLEPGQIDQEQLKLLANRFGLDDKSLDELGEELTKVLAATA